MTDAATALVLFSAGQDSTTCLAWALDRDVPYLDACVRTTPASGQLCDSPTERDTVRLLGPSGTEFWYIVTVDQVESFETGVGYRVSSVEIANKAARMIGVPLLQRLYPGDRLQLDPALLDDIRQRHAEEKRAFERRFLGKSDG